MGCLDLSPEMDTENRHYKLTTLIDGQRGRDDAGRYVAWIEKDGGSVRKKDEKRGIGCVRDQGGWRRRATP